MVVFMGLKKSPPGLVGSGMCSRSGRKPDIVRVMVGSLPFGKMSSE